MAIFHGENLSPKDNGVMRMNRRIASVNIYIETPENEPVTQSVEQKAA